MERHYIGASMGPRFENRGKTYMVVADGAPFASFNGATVRKPWKGPSPYRGMCPCAGLQWGHGSKTVERSDTPDQAGRPDWLQWGHGSKTVERYPRAFNAVAIAWASMGPRFENRGKVGVGCVDNPPDMLQWGHGSKTVERKSRGLYTAGYNRFNGATVRKPWKVLHVDDVF